MRRTVLSLTFILFLTSAQVSLASYEVILKTGKRFISHDYWEEGSLLKIHFKGGILGIEKNLVKDIKESATVCQENEAGINSNAKNNLHASKGEERDSRSKNIHTRGDRDLMNYIQEKKNLIDNLNFQIQKLNQEKKAGIEHRINRRLNKIKDIEEKIKLLKQRVQEFNDGQIPYWWNELRVPKL